MKVKNIFRQIDIQRKGFFLKNDTTALILGMIEAL